jgi:hypothetical protein
MAAMAEWEEKHDLPTNNAFQPGPLQRWTTPNMKNVDFSNIGWRTTGPGVKQQTTEARY